MKPLLLSLALLAAAGASAAAPTNAPASTNGMLWVCEGGFEYNRTNMILRDQVRVLDQASGAYLECDLLTMTFQTNITRPARTNRNPAVKPAPAANPANRIDTSSLESIVAEGNVLLMTSDQQILADRAVYSITNELVVFTGEMVILGSEIGVGLGRKVIFNRATGMARGEGPFAFESLATLNLSATNSPLRRRSTNAPTTAPDPK